MRRKVTMKQFIYFFIIYFLLTLALFIVMNQLSSRTVESSLIHSSKNQMEYADEILDGIISEAALYGTRFVSDIDVRFYPQQRRELGNYDYQMKKNEILRRLEDILISSHVVESIGIYWPSDGTFITTSHDLLASQIYQKVHAKGWQTVGGSLYYFAKYPYIQTDAGAFPEPYIVGVQLKTDYLRSLLGKAVSDAASSNAFYVVNGKELWSNRKVDEQIAAAMPELLVEGIGDGIQDGEIRKFDYKSSEGDFYILAQYIAQIDTYLVTYTRMSDFLLPLDRNRQAFLLSIAAVVLLGLFVIQMFYRNFYRHVHLLRKKFQLVEQGNYNTRIPHKNDNEFSSLFNGFNHMMGEIQGLFASLETETELRRTAEFKQLQAQINPHFLYNSLFYIMSVAHSSPDAIIRMSKHLAEYYRYMTRLDTRPASLASELQLAEHYLAIMSLSKQIRYEIDLPPELADQPVKPLMIQPLVENAIQHGIEGRQGACEVSIQVRHDEEGGVVIAVSDDGKGLEPAEIQLLAERIERSEPPEGDRGIGLWNVSRRLKNTYGESSGLRFVANSRGGLSVLMTIASPTEGGG
ncbi:sensor histidine kinase [Paenibacillus pasadenensis]|uniref:sensor histidine kinase n=1 Tax=Paenibacillus pasadenensis TaxID=217090 RepID=UPI0004079BF1|nr:histidine kinase [Paenibacillus pasadenensis]